MTIQGDKRQRKETNDNQKVREIRDARKRGKEKKRERGKEGKRERGKGREKGREKGRGKDRGCVVCVLDRGRDERSVCTSVGGADLDVVGGAPFASGGR